MNPAGQTETATTGQVPVARWRRPLSGSQVVRWTMTCLLLVAAGSFAWYQHLLPDYTVNGSTMALQSGTGGPARNAFTITDSAFSLIPIEEIHAGGPAKDGIPSLTAPKTVPAQEAGLDPGDRVIGVSMGGEARAYPLRILNWHEIVNDTLGGTVIAVTYCPLCDSAVVFDRTIGGQVREFGVSGLLYNSNVLMYDRQGGDETKESLWSQMMLKAVYGPAAEDGLELTLLPAQLVTWQAWSEEHPGTTSLSFETGHQRDYGGNPYAGYFTTEQLMFPVASNKNGAADAGFLPNKERVIVLKAGSRMKGYPVSRLQAALDSGRVMDEFADSQYTFTEVDSSRGIYRVEGPAGVAVPAAFTFWFEFRTAHPQAEVFGTPSEGG